MHTITRHALAINELIPPYVWEFVWTRLLGTPTVAAVQVNNFSEPELIKPILAPVLSSGDEWEPDSFLTSHHLRGLRLFQAKKRQKTYHLYYLLNVHSVHRPAFDVWELVCHKAFYECLIQSTPEEARMCASPPTAIKVGHGLKS